MLPLDVFAWDANTLSRKFRGCQNGEGFAGVWQKQIVPYLSQSTGLFQFEEVSADSAVSTEPAYASPTSRKRPSTSLSPPALMPTAKASRNLQVGTTSEVEMDRTIQDHFIGKLLIASIIGNLTFNLVMCNPYLILCRILHATRVLFVRATRPPSPS